MDSGYGVATPWNGGWVRLGYGSATLARTHPPSQGSVARDCAAFGLVGMLGAEGEEDVPSGVAEP